MLKHFWFKLSLLVYSVNCNCTEYEIVKKDPSSNCMPTSSNGFSQCLCKYIYTCRKKFFFSFFALKKNSESRDLTLAKIQHLRCTKRGAIWPEIFFQILAILGTFGIIFFVKKLKNALAFQMTS